MERHEHDAKINKYWATAMVLVVLIIFGTIAAYYGHKNYARSQRPEYKTEIIYQCAPINDQTPVYQEVE